jgi:hypothetical protein
MTARESKRKRKRREVREGEIDKRTKKEGAQKGQSRHARWTC